MKTTSLPFFLLYIPILDFHSFPRRMADKKKKYVIVEFLDGLQIIPITWLTTDLKRAKWPDCYISNSRFDKAVRCLEEPDSTWQEHPIVKIYATCCK